MQEIKDAKQFIEDAKNSLIEVSDLKSKEEELNQSYAECKMDLESAKKALEDKIKITVDTRVAEINKTYNDEISILEDKAKKAKSNREKAKNKGVKDRIKDETKQLVEENKSLRQKMKYELKANSLPSFCASKLYIALYFPHRLIDFLLLLICFSVCFALIPWLLFIFLPFPENNIVRIMIIYVAVIFVFGFIYIFIGNKTKSKNKPVLKKVVATYDMYQSNKKRINLIIKDIKRDDDEAVYKLDSFDEDISNLNKQIEELNEKKQEALANFENTTKKILVDEINANANKDINILEEKQNSLKAEIDTLANVKKEKNLYISDNYEAYLGKEFLDLDKIAILQELMEEKSFESISEAIDYYKTLNS